MAVSSAEPIRGVHTDNYPLLLEGHDSQGNEEHVIDIVRGGEASSSNATDSAVRHSVSPNNDHPETSGIHEPFPSLSSHSRTLSRSSSFVRRSEGTGRRNWSPFNSGFWISIELILTLSQIIASMTVLCLSRHEHPQAPLFSWIVGYTAGCFASLPVLYWRFLHRNQSAERVALQANQTSPRVSSPSGPNSYVTISLGQTAEQENRHSIPGATSDSQTNGIVTTRYELNHD